jgi:hypothetical protein
MNDSKSLRGYFMKKTLFFAFLLVTSLILSACAPSVEVITSWKDDSMSSRTYEDVLVVGVTRDMTTQRIFEDYFVKELEAANVSAMPSYKYMTGDMKGDQEQLKKVVKKSGAKNVLVTRLVDKKTETNISSPAVSVHYGGGPAAYYHGGMYGYYGHSVQYMPPLETTTELYYLESSLYDVASDKLLWTAQVEAVDPVRSEDQFKRIVKALMEDLRQQKQK